MDSETAAVTVGAATAGSLLTGVGAWLVNAWKAKTDQDRQIRKDTIDELYKLSGQLRADNEVLETKLEVVRRELIEYRVRYSRLLERKDTYEQMLSDAKIPFRPYKPEGTDDHVALPPTPKGGS